MRANEFIYHNDILQEIISDTDVQNEMNPYVIIPRNGKEYYILMIHVDSMFGEKIVGMSKSTNAVKIHSVRNGIGYYIDSNGNESATIGSASSAISTDMVTMFFETESEMESFISHIILKYDGLWDIMVTGMKL